MKISTALLQTRKEKGLRQTAVAKGCQITQTYLSQIETGDKIPSMEVIEKLARFYNTPLAVMLWRSIEDKDISKKKLPYFRMIKTSVDDLINSVFE